MNFFIFFLFNSHKKTPKTWCFLVFLVLVKFLHRTRHKTLLCKAKIATFCKAFVFYICTTRIALLLKTELHSAKFLQRALQKFYIAQNALQKPYVAQNRVLLHSAKVLRYSKQSFVA